MKKLICSLFIAILLFSCSGDPIEPNNNSGRLMSITSYGLGDSATTAVQYQKFTFNYDNYNRVSEILKSSNNLTVTSSGIVKFLYQNSSELPYLMIDSTISSSTNTYIERTFFYYDGSNRKLKDSTYSYSRDPNNLAVIVSMQPTNQHWVNSYTYTPIYDVRQVTKGLGTGFYRDSLFYGPNNDYSKVKSYIIHNDSISLSYYDEINPQATLNISKALVNVFDFWGVNFHPFRYDMNKPYHLPKSIFCKHLEVTSNQTINLDYYYSKNSAGKIGKIVVAKRRKYWPSGTLFDFYYTTYVFDYYP